MGRGQSHSRPDSEGPQTPGPGGQGYLQVRRPAKSALGGELLPVEPADPGRLPGDAGAARASRRPGPVPGPSGQGRSEAHWARVPPPQEASFLPWDPGRVTPPLTLSLKEVLVWRGRPGPRGILGSDVGRGWRDRPGPRDHPWPVSGDEAASCVRAGSSQGPAAKSAQASQICTLGTAGHHSLAFPSLEGPWFRPAQPASLAHPPEFPDGECHPLEPGSTLCPPRPAPRPPPRWVPCSGGPVPLGPLCRVPAGFRTTCLTVYTALLRSVQAPPLCLLAGGHLHLRYWPEDLDVTAPWLRPPHPHHQNSASRRHSLASERPRTPGKKPPGWVAALKTARGGGPQGNPRA